MNWAFRKVYFFTFVILLLGSISCRPNLSENDPRNLIWDQDILENQTRLKKLTQATGLRLFWWNVAWGRYNERSLLDHNLKEIVSSDSRPDILVLGEYKSTVLEQETHNILQANYPYQSFTTYSKTSEVGVKVYSILPFSKIGTYDLPWHPIQFTNDSDIQEYRQVWKDIDNSSVKHWDRRTVILKFNYLGSSYYLMPVHLLAPWEVIAKARGEVAAIKNFINGGDNPLGHQVGHLRKIITRKFGSVNAHPLIMLGDFNIPKYIYGLTPAIFSKLADGFRDAHFGNPTSFPTKKASGDVPSSLSYLGLKIDHILLNKKFKRVGAATLNLVGSDHYPIYGVVYPGEEKWWE